MSAIPTKTMVDFRKRIHVCPVCGQSFPNADIHGRMTHLCCADCKAGLPCKAKDMYPNMHAHGEGLIAYMPEAGAQQ